MIKTEIIKETGKALFIWTELQIVRLIIGSDNIFYIEVNGALAIHVIEEVFGNVNNGKSSMLGQASESQLIAWC